MEQHQGSLQFVDIVAGVSPQSAETNAFEKPIEARSAQYGITNRSNQVRSPQTFHSANTGITSTTISTNVSTRF